MAAPISTALKMPGCSRNFQSDLVSDCTTDLVSCNCVSTSTSERYILRKMRTARSSRPFRMSQRGLSGMKKMMQKKRMAGRLQKPSMPRHTSDTNTRFIHPA